MHDTKTLLKIFNLRNREKQDAQLAHHDALTAFEKQATTLYNLLRKKETAESSFQDQLKNLNSVQCLQDSQQYIQRLNEQIMLVQGHVHEARQKMTQKQLDLSHAHVETKKIEKMLEERQRKQRRIEMKEEQAEMDELSMLQYSQQGG